MRMSWLEAAFPWSAIKTLLHSLLLGVGLAFAAHQSAAQDFDVTASDFSDYMINGERDPALTLQRGVTYVFAIGNLAIHPFWIKSAPGIGGTGAYNNGVLNNGATTGNITFTVPADAPDNLLYQCGNHATMLGTIAIETPASPPTVRIVFINVQQFITVTSTGTNGWSAVPEFKCGPDTPGWSEVAPFTNSYSGGTNITTFPLLDAVCGSTNVLIRIRNDQD